MRTAYWLTVFLLYPFFMPKAQCPVNTGQNFGVDEAVCPFTNVIVSNPAPSANSWQWNFCANALEREPQANTSLFLDGSIVVYPQLIFDGTEYYLFAVSRETNELIRVRLGNSPLNAPIRRPERLSLTFLDRPEAIDFVQENGQWYAIMLNSSIIAGGSRALVRVNFGSSLSGNPTATPLGDLGLPQTSRGLKLVRYNQQYYILIANASSNKLYIVGMGGSITNAINASNIVQEINFPAGDYIWNVNAFEDCGQLYVWVLGLTANKSYLLHFPNGPSSPPQQQDYSNIIGVIQPSGVYTIRMGSRIHAFFSSNNQTRIYKAVFEGSLLTPPQQVGSVNIPSANILGLTGSLHEGLLHLHLINYNTRIGYRLHFNQCDASVVTTNTENPEIQFKGLGEQRIVLEAIESGNTQIFEGSISIATDAIIPDFSFSQSCSQQNVIFENQSIGPLNSATNWIWDFGDNTPPLNAFSATHSYAAPGSYTVSLTVQTAGGCVATKSRTINISGQLVADFSIDGQLCVGNTLQFQDNSTWSYNPPDPVQGYYWDFGDDTYSVLANPQKTYQTPGTYTVSLTIKDVSGCSASIANTIVVAESPDIAFEVPNNICPAVDVHFSAQGPDMNAVSYAWYVNGQLTSQEMNSILNFPTAGTYEVTLTATLPNGCSSSYTRTVVVNAQPLAWFSMQPDENNPLRIQFQNQTIGATHYLWDFGDGFESTDINPVHTYAQSGNYTVRLIAYSPNNCIAEVSQNVPAGRFQYDLHINRLNFTAFNQVFELELLNRGNISVDAFRARLFSGSEILLDTLIVQWLAPDETASLQLQVNRPIEQIMALRYVCANVNIENVPNTSSNYTEKCIALEEVFYVFAPYPNPSSQEFYLKWIQPPGKTIQMTLYDSRGARVLERSLPTSAVGSVRIQLANVPSGLYYLQVRDERQQYVFRLIIQK